MPFLAAIPALLATIGGGSALAGAATVATLASTGIAVGEDISNLSNQPSAPKVTAATPVAQTAATNAAQTSQASSISSDVQAATSGSVGPDYLASVLNTAFQGNPQATGNWQQAINGIFGLGAPGQSTASGGISTSPGTSATSTTGGQGNSITDILNRVATPQQGQGSVINSALNDSFKGFS